MAMANRAQGEIGIKAYRRAVKYSIPYIQYHLYPHGKPHMKTMGSEKKARYIAIKKLTSLSFLTNITNLNYIPAKY